jgi:DNA ligase-1
MIKDFSVQLCKEIDWDTVTYPCLVEVKRDGRRNIAVVIQGKVTHYSRNGKINENYHCFDEELVKIADHQDVVFDGEVSGIVTGDNREERRLSQQQANRKTNVDMSKQVYTVWDWLPLGTWKSQSKSNKLNFRFDTLLHAFKQYRDTTDVEDLRVRFTKWIYAKNRDEIIVFYEKAIKAGCEGVVVKNLNSLYEFKRSSAWMKLKPEHTDDFKIVEVLEGKKSREGTLGSIVVDVKGVKVRCGLGRGVSIADCKSLWRRRSKLIGMVAEITHGGFTLDGSMIVPKFIRIRDDK